MASYDKSLPVLVSNFIYKSCFKEIFREKVNVEAGDQELEAFDICMKNFVGSFRKVADGYHSYVVNIPTHKEKELA